MKSIQKAIGLKNFPVGEITEIGENNYNILGFMKKDFETIGIISVSFLLLVSMSVREWE